jgi:nucleoside-diphosphate-sugar epimerase
LGGEKIEIMSDEKRTKMAEEALVTGGGGFLGKAIVSRLIKRGYLVRSLARNFYPELEKMGVDQIQGDISNIDNVARACEGRTIVYHVAAKPPPWGRYEDYHQINVIGTQNIIDTCLAQDQLRLIYTSTPSVVNNGKDIEGADESLRYPERFNAHYSKTKAIAEKLVVKASRNGLNTIILRPHKIWGPGDTQILTRLVARAEKLKQIGDGKNLIDVTYIDDAADAHVLAGDKLKENPKLSGNIYFISQGEPVSAWYMINAFLAAAGQPPVKKAVSYRMAWVIGAALEFFYRTFNISKEPYLTRFLVDSVAKSNWFDICAAKRDLGYVPRVSIEEGLRRLEEWLGNTN